MPIVVGMLILGLLGLAHYMALYRLAHFIRFDGDRKRRAVLFTFLGLALIHVVEIAAIAVLFWTAEQLFWQAGVPPEVSGWWDYHYIAFMTFTSLGFGDMDIHGPIRIVLGHIALGGFMVITWSATFLYDVTRKVTDFTLEEDGQESGEAQEA